MSDGLVAEVALLLAFLEKVPLTDAVRNLEHELDGCDGKSAAARAAAAGVSLECLQRPWPPGGSSGGSTT